MPESGVPEPEYHSLAKDDANIPTADIIKAVVSDGEDIGMFVEEDGALVMPVNDVEGADLEQDADDDSEKGLDEADSNFDPYQRVIKCLLVCILHTKH